ncbi:hypothetical protein F4861DRAFT_513935 [Xylaria intraflava]|nr:hypothetical protein F4861DRAFT_513935 [Xylaria intraflava]
MSFLTEKALRRMATISRVASVPAPRRFSAGIVGRKSVAQSAKDTLKSVDRKVSDKLVDGINVGTKAAETISGKTTRANYKSAGNAEEIRQKMKAEADELARKAKGAAKGAEETIKDTAKKAGEELKSSM